MAHQRLFEKTSHVEKYAKFRPTYPPEIFKRMLSFIGEKKAPPYDVQLDVGCGSGQATYGLTSHFERVTGLDVSEAQIEAASKKNTAPNVEFRVSPSESLPVGDGTVDLVTCAEAAHWFDFPAFCLEADRVLKPLGCLVVYWYGLELFDHPNLDIKRQLQHDFDELYNNSLGPYWNTRSKKHEENQYRDFSLPYEGSIRDDSYEMRNNWTVGHLIGYIQSWSAHQAFLDKNPSGQTLLKDYEKRVLSALGDANAAADSTKIDLVRPMFMLLGRKPCGT